MSAPVDWRAARALVLGASGFLGRWVARELSARGAALTLVARDTQALERARGTWRLAGAVLEADLAREGEATRCVRAARPHVVFNLAGYGVDRGERDESLAEALNARLPGELAAAVAAHRDPAWKGVALVHTGSALEYGVLATHLGETEVPQPTTVYGRTKLAGTYALLERASALGLRAVVARLFTVYGPGEHEGRLLPSLRSAAARSERVSLSTGLQERDFTYVEDVSEGLLRLAALTSEALPGQALVNLATGRLASVRAFAETAARELGLPREALDFGALPARSDDMRHLPVRVERLRELTGWVPATSPAEGVRRAVQRERELAGA